MMFDDKYKEVRSQAVGSYREKGSKFISYSFPVYSENDIIEKINIIKKKERSASHYCYAYILNPDKSAKRFSDDGEPSSTAGKQIYNQILSSDLTNILIIVVRYYGGRKLGIPGLIRSYKNAAIDAIEKSEFVIKNIEEEYLISFKYDEINKVMRLIKDNNLKISNKEINEYCKITVSIPRKNSEEIIKKVNENYKLNIKYIKTK